MSRSLENRCVISVETPFDLDYGRVIVGEYDRVIMPIDLTRRLPFPDESMILHVIQDSPNEIPFLAHRRGELPANPLDRPAKQAALVEVCLRQPVITEPMGVSLQDLCELFDEVPEIRVPLAGHNGHRTNAPVSALVEEVVPKGLSLGT